MEKKDIKQQITVKRIVKVIALILIVLFFVPLFTVSCSGETIGFSAARLTIGYSYRGERVVNPQIIYSLLLLIPIAVFLAEIYIKKKDQYNIVVGASGLINVILLFSIITRAKVEAESQYVDYKTNFAFYINVFFNLLLIAVAVIEFTGLTEKIPLLGSDLGDTSPKICKECGASIKPGFVFCGECGTEYKEEDKDDEEDEIIQESFCTQCGAKIEKGAGFCTKCGNKVE